MEFIYLIFVIILFLLAASDLVVGVSNDAVNFLNSAIGSKVASFRTIMIVASIGIIIGATFSSGMMEVARKGIFNPQYFNFSEIMIIFLAVMITDVMLLDAFNTFGMPTSTTVSIVFELLGAAVGISLIKTLAAPGGITVGQYINSSQALLIISGILLSVVIAFIVGALVMFLARLVFSFSYKTKLKYIGSIWGGIAITAITYFILVKGAKGASFMSDEVKEFIRVNAGLIIAVSFVFWTIMLQLISWLTRFDILKFIVLVGTFALAMAFAGNDLVNFIGVPLAGFESFKDFTSSPGAVPDDFLMDSLTGPVKTSTYMLIIAGLIMVVTLWTSRKARSVTQTEINLARQEEGYERFGSSGLARSIVRSTANVFTNTGRLLPKKWMVKIERQFNQKDYKKEQEILGDDAPYFDSVRASVNLVVASILIAFATSLKLPLSTTYVTFMVAMGTSLSDRAWGRESAVYRITGVLSVIGGWFLTAMVAFSVSFLVAYLLHYGGLWSLAVLLIIAAFTIYRTHLYHNRTRAAKEVEIDEIEQISDQNIAERSTRTIIENLKSVSKGYAEILQALQKEDLKILRKVHRDLLSSASKIDYLKNNLNIVVDKLKEEYINNAYQFVGVLEYMGESLSTMLQINELAYDHVNNHHNPLEKVQFSELEDLHKLIVRMLEAIVDNMESGKYNSTDIIQQIQDEISRRVLNLRKKQIKRIKSGQVGTKNSMLYFFLVGETRNLVIQISGLYSSQHEFIDYKNQYSSTSS